MIREWINELDKIMEAFEAYKNDWEKFNNHVRKLEAHLKMTQQRKSITIPISEFEEWETLKQDSETWSSLMRRIRMGWNDFKNLNIIVNSTIAPIVGASKSISTPDYRTNTVGVPPKLNPPPGIKRKKLQLLWPLPLLQHVLDFFHMKEMREKLASENKGLVPVPEAELDYRKQEQENRIIKAKQRLGLA